MLATTVAAAVPAHAVDEPVTVGADETLTVDTQLPGSFGESGNPTAFTVVVRNPGEVHPNVQLAFGLTPRHGVTADHFDLAFRDPATGTWQNVELRDQADGSGIVGGTGLFALAAARQTSVRLRFAYHPGPFDATILDPREVTVQTSLVENGPDGQNILASDFDLAPILRMAVYFTGRHRQLKAGGAPATFEIRYTNASENAYQPVRPFLFVQGQTAGLTAAHTRLEWQNPRTGAWTVVPLVDTGNGQSASFTDAQAVVVREQSTATVKLRLSVASGVTGGRVLLRADGFVPADRGFGLNLNQTYVVVR